ncbi:hypothetical protein O181_108240 [Austropuccinia psidii MF-1]|uniref:Uncharacterized protein n=1 Tax=Austropuccinia psidii MF-1 TaxID=1389203 RepID=A0A9Q3JW21_9BASI|nr:hypothetical protein [Austropuccinia psidii MF-1]
MNLYKAQSKPEDREGFSRSIRPGRGRLGQSGGWQDTEGNHTHSAIHLPIQQKPQTRGLEAYGSISSAPPTTQRYFPMEHGQKEFRVLDERETTIRENQVTIQAIEEQLNQIGPTLIPSGSQGVDQPNSPVASHHSCTSRSVAKSHHSSQSQVVSRGRQGCKGKKQDIFQPKEERVRPNDPEPMGLGERSAQDPEIVVNTSRISSPNNKNITPTQNEHNVVTSESKLNSDAMWLQMSQFEEKTPNQFSELQESHESMKALTASIKSFFKTLQEGHVPLSKASEETNKRLNQVFEEQNHCKRDRDFLDQDVNKLFNVYQSMKPQPQGNILDDPNHQDDIKPDSLLMNKARYPAQYQDGDYMSYSEREALKQLPEASSWPKFSGKGEYNHMELIDHIDGLFIDVPRIPDYWITVRLNTELKVHASIWYIEMK